ncbi:MAG TPA: PilZ domain-containing protein [Anaeromyxobacteraceae bacterium]|nr:PilZ domain-containing protein [Anaeromyxobacteraceae bacterium]
MAEFIVNARHTPRALVRCQARAPLLGGGFWSSDTEDIGPRGCQLVAPARFTPGEGIELELSSERVSDPLWVGGRIAWAADEPPWRVGIAFSDQDQDAAARWFDRLVAAFPGLDGSLLAPRQIPADATIYLGRAPRLRPPLVAPEIEVLRAVGRGTTAAALRDRLGAGWEDGQGALFSLLGRRFLTLSASEAATPEAWASYL